MKHVVLFSVRLFGVVLWSVLVFVLYYPVKFMYYIWHLKLDGFPDFKVLFGTENCPFYEEENFIEPSWHYTTIWDYLLDHKKWYNSEDGDIESSIQILVDKHKSKK